jgi:putative transposase
VSRTVSPSVNRVYGLARVCTVWHVPRATLYRRRRSEAGGSRHRPGPAGPMRDAELVDAIRELLAESGFHGEGYRKIWARLRFKGIRTSKRRVLRLTREHGLQAPHRLGRPRGPRAHDGTIRTERVDEMWGTDLTATLTGEGQAAVFILVDHCSGECLGIHAARRATRFEALEPLRQAVRHSFGAFGKGLGQGTKLRHDHGSQFVSDDFQAEVAFLGLESSPLGSVDILPQQDASGDEMNECEITPGELVEAAEDAAEVLHLAEQALDRRTLLVEAPVGLACRGAGRMGWDDRHGLLLCDPGEDGVAVISAIGEHRLDRGHRDGVEQRNGLGRITGLARRQGEAQRLPRLSASRAACWRTRPVSVQGSGPLHFFCPGSAGVSAHHGALQHQPLEVALGRQRSISICQTPFSCPSREGGETFVDAVPRAELGRQQSPRRTGAAHPHGRW